MLSIDILLCSNSIKTYVAMTDVNLELEGRTWTRKGSTMYLMYFIYHFETFAPNNLLRVAKAGW